MEARSDRPGIKALCCNVGYSRFSGTQAVGTTTEWWTRNVDNALVLRPNKRDLDVKYVREIGDLRRILGE